MALSTEDRTEVQLLVMLEVGKILNESSGFSEARRAIKKRIEKLEAEHLAHQSVHKETISPSTSNS